MKSDTTVYPKLQQDEYETKSYFDEDGDRRHGTEDIP